MKNSMWVDIVVSKIIIDLWIIKDLVIQLDATAGTKKEWKTTTQTNMINYTLEEEKKDKVSG